MSGADTTSSKARRTGRHPGLEHVVKEAHWAGVLRPCLRGTVECRYHEREVQDTRRRTPGNHSPMRQSLAHPGARRPAQLERPSLIREMLSFRSVNKPKQKKRRFSLGA
jgi:hypothetical protein